MKLLIVDDDVVDRKLIRRTLNDSRSYFYDVVDATSVKEGLAAIEAGRFDAILLDYSMPQANGIEMIIEMRARPALGDTAIVMVSASEDGQLALDCIEAGAQDFIPKSEITHAKLNKAILHARKRFEIEQRMHESYLAVKRMAERDVLTGLSNRYHFEEILKVVIATNRRLNNSVALLALDLDNFKNVNDTLGHGAGDAVLVETVRRIADCLRENEGFARLGGDEFAVIIGGVNSLSEVSAIARRILGQFEAPFVIDGNDLHVGVSIGAAVCPADTTDPNELMKCADIAMYRSKRAGKSEICFYEARYQAEFFRRVTIQNSMAAALKNTNFRLFYQPIYRAADSTLTGVEALVRWPDTEPSYMPDEFIPIAEESRMIVALGRWIFEAAVDQLAEWQKNFSQNLHMSINVSPIQLQDDELLPSLIATVDEKGVAPGTLTLEITETALFKDNKKISETLNALSSHGFRIALDDFGMGFSSIAHLVDYPIDIVKLDKSLQTVAGTAQKQGEILEGLVLMLRKLGFETVAEGIETEEQRDLCVALGLDCLQGFLMSRPGPPEELGRILSSQVAD